MKLKDLKQGMVCELRNGYEIIILRNDRYVFDRTVNVVYQLSKDYNDDLISIDRNIDYDIIKVTFGNDIIHERKESNLFFEPKKGENYCYIADDRVTGYENDGEYDDAILRTNIVYKTIEEAKKELLRRQAKIRVIKEIARLNQGWTPNWNDNERKYYIDFLYGRDELAYNFCVTSKHLDNNLYLKTDYVANQLIETHSDDLKLMLEVER